MENDRGILVCGVVLDWLHFRVEKVDRAHHLQAGHRSEVAGGDGELTTSHLEYCDGAGRACRWVRAQMHGSRQSECSSDDGSTTTTTS